MAETRLRLGETLIEAGVLTPEALERALEIQKERQLRLGTILLQEGFVMESQLVQALSLKLSIPWVSLWRIDVPDELLDMVPANVAEEFFLMPIYIRTTKDGERALYVAMNDPTDEDALRFVKATAGMQVKPMIAGPSDIAAAIRFYYYDEEDVAPDDPAAESAALPVAPPGPQQARGSAPPPVPRDKPQAAPPPPPEAAKNAEEIEELDADELGLEPEEEADESDEEEERETAGEESETEAEAEAEEPEEEQADREEDQEEREPDEEARPDEEPGEEPDEEPVEEEQEDTEDHKRDPGVPPPRPEAKVFADKTAAQREAERRMFGVGGDKPKGAFSLTLLDGTTLSFGPGGKKKRPVAPRPEDLDAGDLIAGLKAAAEGTPLDDFLPSERWEAYLGALLRVLFRKHLVFYDEFKTELLKMTRAKDEE
ncbi:MAG: hypothetical protein R6V85_13255 [Polyangia bacterium]